MPLNEAYSKFIFSSFFLKVDLATRSLVLTDDQLEKVSALLLKELNEGLRRETNPIASVKMYPTYVRDVPDGTGK